MHGAVAERLLQPMRQVDLGALAASWFAADVIATLPGLGPLAGDMDLMRLIRGAAGAVLLRSASAEAKAGRACPWQPPCALDLLFREQARLPGGRGIPKPWVLATDRRGAELLVRLTLFGFAAEWAGVVGAALVDALVHGVAWQRVQRDLFKPDAAVSDLRVVEISGLPEMPRPDTALLTLVTPLDAEVTDLRDAPWGLVGRAARRIAELARWQDAEVSTPVEALAQWARSLRFDAGGLSVEPIGRVSGRSGAGAFRQPMHRGSLLIGDTPEELWPLLRLAEACHVGRGATAGFGRLRVTAG